MTIDPSKTYIVRESTTLLKKGTRVRIDTIKDGVDKGQALTGKTGMVMCLLDSGGALYVPESNLLES